MTILSTMLRRSIEDPLRPLTDSTLISVLGGSTTRSGISVSEETAVRKYIALYRAITLVSGSIASLPFGAHRQQAGGPAYASQLLQEPHPDMPPMEVWEHVFCSLLSAGFSASLKIRDSRDRITGIEPLSPRSVKRRHISRTNKNPWGVEFDLRMDDGSTKTLDRWDVLYIPGPFGGLSPIGVARESIGGSLAAEEYSSRLWASGSLMAGVLQTDAALDEDQATALKNRWKEKVAGLAKAHEVAVLDRGAKFHSIAINPADAQLIESREFGILMIAVLYGLPPHLVGLVDRSTSWGTGIEQQNIGLVVYTLTPWMTRVEQRVSRELLPPGIVADFNTKGLLRGDIKTRYEAYAKGVLGGFLKPREARDDEGWERTEGDDRLYLPMNLRAADQEASLKERGDMAGALVRAGFDPTDSLKLAGLDPIKHLGLLPVTVQAPKNNPPEGDPDATEGQ